MGQAGEFVASVERGPTQTCRPICCVAAVRKSGH